MIAVMGRAWGWGGVLVALGLLVAGAAQDAPTADTVVRASAGTAHLGVGYRFPNDGWMGTYVVGNRPTFCIDLNGRGPSTASGYVAAPAARLKKQVGWSPDHRGGTADALTGPALTAQELGRLAYLTDRYAATTSPVTAAAAEHVVRLLTVGDAAQSRREKARWAQTLAAHPKVKHAFDDDGEGRRRPRRPLHADRDVGHQAVRDHAGQPQDHPAVRRERRHARGRPDRFGDRQRPPDHRPTDRRGTATIAVTAGPGGSSTSPSPPGAWRPPSRSSTHPRTTPTGAPPTTPRSAPSAPHRARASARRRAPPSPGSPPSS